MKWVWKEGTKVHEHPNYVEYCTCDLYVKLLDPAFHMADTFFVPRRRNLAVKNSDEMFEDLAVDLAVTWKMHLGVFSLQKGDQRIREAIVRSLGTLGVNQVPIPSPIITPFLPRENSYEYFLPVLKLYRKWDMHYYEKYLGLDRPEEWWRNNVWKAVYSQGGILVDSGIPWNQGFGDLQLQALREASFFNKTFSGTIVEGTMYWYSVYSQEGLYPNKIPTLVKKYDQPTHEVTQFRKDNMHLDPLAIKMMNEYAGWDKFYHKLTWSYARNSQFINPPLTTSSGNRPGEGETIIYEDEFMTIYKNTNGKKMEQIEWSLVELEKWVHAIINDEPYTPPMGYYKVVIKSEIHLATGIGADFIASLKKVSLKAREYFIPDVFTINLAMLLHGERHKLERGKLIRIGINWNHGGMHFFATDFKYNLPYMWWFMCDINHYDKIVKAIDILLCNAATKQWYNFFDEDEEKVYRTFARECGDRTAFKITQLLGNVWRAIFGDMPSGCFQTSNMNSWIAGKEFFSLFVWYLLNDFEFRCAFIQCMAAAEVVVSVYGDDNLSGWNGCLNKWLNEKSLPKFFWEHNGWTCRDIVFTNKFLSTPDGLGNLKEKNAVFLQMYAVELPRKYAGPGMPDIVHYRPMDVNIRKYGKGSSGDKRGDIEYLLSAISGPYNNPCNEHWVEFCHMSYKYFLKRVPNWAEKVDYALLDRHSVVTRGMRKMHITKDEIKKGFPTIHDLKRLLKVDKEKYEQSYAADIWSGDL